MRCLQDAATPASELVVDVRWVNGRKIAVLRSSVVLVNDTDAAVDVQVAYDPARLTVVK